MAVMIVTTGAGDDLRCSDWHAAGGRTLTGTGTGTAGICWQGTPGTCSALVAWLVAADRWPAAGVGGAEQGPGSFRGGGGALNRWIRKRHPARLVCRGWAWTARRALSSAVSARGGARAGCLAASAEAAAYHDDNFPDGRSWVMAEKAFSFRAAGRRRGRLRHGGAVIVVAAAIALAGTACTTASSGPVTAGLTPPAVIVLKQGADNGNGGIFIAPDGGSVSGPEIISNTST